jgi:hypothetical protein
MTRFEDGVTIAGTRKNSEGYLIADAKVVRTGVQKYYGKELGLADDHPDVMKLFSVYRSEAEVRNVDSLKTFSHAPVTIGHPDEDVSAINWKDLAKGEVSTEARWEDNHIRLPLILKDSEAIDLVETQGVRDLSAGYRAEIVFVDGVTPDGEEYQAEQRNIRINHVAIVPQGRAGSARIGDKAPAGNWGAVPFTDKEKPMSNQQTIVFDGISIPVTDQAAQAITKMQDANKSLQTKLDDAEARHTKELATKDERIGELEVENKKLKDSQLDDKAIDRKVQDRIALVDAARAVDKDVKVEGISDADIRRAVVSKVMGAEAINDANDDMVRGMFKAVTAEAVKDAGRDPLVRGLGGSAPTVPVSDAEAEDKAYLASVADLNRAPAA